MSKKKTFRNFKRYGQIRGTHLVRGAYEQSRGFGFIEFVEREAQQWCLQDTLSHVIDETHWLTVNPARPGSLPDPKPYKVNSS